jgi:general secretion pathway protein I
MAVVTRAARATWVMAVTAGIDASRQRGFTLIEVVVALLIVTIGFAAAFGAMPQSQSAQAASSRMEEATELAQSLLPQSDRLPANGETRDYAWHFTSAALPNVSPLYKDFGGQIVTLTLSWREAGNDRAITLQTVRLGRP